eukprot:457147_1
MGNANETQNGFEFNTKEEIGSNEIENYIIISKDKKHNTIINDEKQNESLNVSTFSGSKRLIYYSPTENNEPNPVTLNQISQSIDPQTNKPYITHIEICSLHLSKFSDGSYIHINDLPPTNSNFTSIKSEISTCQSSGIKILFMIGGAEGKNGIAPKSESTWVNLFNDWDTFYPKLISLCKDWNVNGIDLDCENVKTWQNGITNYSNICRLITNLNKDMGNTFDIVLSPVAEAIYNNLSNGGLSGFNYKKLMDNYGNIIGWLNLQFYNKWGSLQTPNEYERCVSVQGFNSQQLVAGMLQCSDDGSRSINSTIQSLSSKYGKNFGGVDVWEGNNVGVIQWSKDMANDMK